MRTLQVRKSVHMHKVDKKGDIQQNLENIYL